MRRIMAIFLISVVLSGCSSFIGSVEQNAQAKLQGFLAKQFGKRLGSSIDAVITQLSKKGGFLDDPLVRILLPPPLGMAIGVAKELKQNPKAALLETLINQAAENAIPVAGPILKNIVKNMDGPSLQNLMDAGDTAATDYLKEKGGAMVTGALLPAITQELHANGAMELYGKLLDAKAAADQVAETVQGAQQQVESAQQKVAAVQLQAQLDQYVAEQAMSGLFKQVADQELSIRGTLDSFQ